MQDIIPKDKRSIRDIPIEKKIPERREMRLPREPEIVEEKPVHVPIHARTQSRPVPPPAPQPVQPIQKEQHTYRFDDSEQDDFLALPRKASSKSMTKILTITAIILAAVVVIGGYALFYSKAVVTVTPKTQQISLSSNVDASLAGQGTTSSLTYRVETIDAEEAFTVPANGEERADVKAKGTIIISNSYSKASQKLIANTRFESKEGKIYRIGEAVTVPGQSTVGGKLVPGTVTVSVTADAIGESYNTSNTTFTIPGFKGDPRYDKFTAVVKSNITGGFSGTRKKISQSDVTTKTGEAVARLKSKLADEMKTKLGTSSVSVSVFYETKEPTQAQTDTAVTLTQSVEAHAIVIDAAELSDHLISQSGIASGENKLFINDFSGFNFALIKSPEKPWLANTLSFSISGKAKVISYYNAEKLKEDLAGTSKKDLTLILSKYTGIQEAEAIVRPFWKSSFPGSPRQITIKESE